jgi:hypothetical protein
MRLISSLCLILLMALTGCACAAFPDARGLQISLVTELSRFKIPLVAGDAAPSPKHSFAASIALTNRGRSPVSLTYAGQSGEVFKVTLLDASGAVVWTSVPDPETNGVESDPAQEQFLLNGLATLRRTIRVPLKTSEGQWLPAGRCTLRAETGLGEALAQVPIDIVGTGIRGQVIFRESSPGTTNSAPVQATVTVSEMRLPNVKYDHPAFEWSGLTDSQGHFNVATPAGRFNLFAQSDLVIEDESFIARFVTVNVAPGEFSVQNIVIPGRLRVPKQIIDSVISASIQPTVLGSLDQPVFGFRVTAQGRVPSSGWTFPELVRRQSAQAGVIEFDFKALPPPPNGAVSSASVPIEAVTWFEISGPWPTIQVSGQNGTITATYAVVPIAQ